MAAEGITFITGTEVGKNYPAEKLLQEFNAVALCGGATKPRDLPMEGRGLKGIHFAMEFLHANTRNLLCPEGASSGASVSTALDGRGYSLGVLFPGKGEDPHVYRVRVQEMRSVPASGEKDGSTGGVIPPTLLNVPVRCPRGHVGVVGFSDFKGEPLLLVLSPREIKGEE